MIMPRFDCDFRINALVESLPGPTAYRFNVAEVSN